MNPAEAYILEAAQPYRAIMLRLQLVIEATVPTAVLRYKYGIPFYYHDNGKPFCYLNQTKDYVDLGFWHAAHLTLHSDKLISEKRTYVRSLRFRMPDEVDEEVLITLLQEAVSVKDRPYYS